MVSEAFSSSDFEILVLEPVGEDGVLEGKLAALVVQDVLFNQGLFGAYHRGRGIDAVFFEHGGRGEAAFPGEDGFEQVELLGGEVVGEVDEKQA